MTAILPPDAPAAAGRAGVREAVCALARSAQGKGVHDAASRRKIIERRKEDEERLKQQRDREVSGWEGREERGDAQDAAVTPGLPTGQRFRFTSPCHTEPDFEFETPPLADGVAS